MVKKEVGLIKFTMLLVRISRRMMDGCRVEYKEERTGCGKTWLEASGKFP